MYTCIRTCVCVHVHIYLEINLNVHVYVHLLPKYYVATLSETKEVT